MWTYQYFLNIQRPLFFLCGPYFDETDKRDRRKILRDYINSNEISKEKYQPIPFIVDPLFDDNTIKKYNLNLSLVEEIIANVAHKTYIFLDTLSTATELGLFMNNSANNEVQILIPKGVKVGEFIRLSVETRGEFVKTIEYNFFTEEEKDKKHYFFNENQIDKKIRKQIDNDISTYFLNSPNRIIEFCEGSGVSKNTNEINYVIIGETIVLNIGLKTLFYSLLSAPSVLPLQKFSSITITRNLVNEVFLDIKKMFTEAFTLNCQSNKTIISLMNLNNQTFEFKIQSSKTTDINELLEHMLRIIQLIQINNDKEKSKGPIVLSLSNSTPIHKSMSIGQKASYYDLFDITDEDKRTIKSFSSAPDKYINERIITIKGKKRKVVSYKTNKYGLELRRLHKKINYILQYFVFSDSANAYIKKKSILTAIERHKTSKAFLKMDIENFFGSIRKSKLEKLIYCLNDDNKVSCLNSIFKLDISNIKARKFYTPTIRHEGLKDILNVCFYKSNLPLGFITSPSFSNIYLTPFDEIISDVKEINYSRYADDILLSVTSKKECFQLIMTETLINETLKRMLLSSKPSKRRMKVFTNIGDHFKVLGVNIVNDNPENRLTVSQSYILNLINIELRNNCKQVNLVRGRVQFIKNTSQESYEKYLKIRALKLKNKNKTSH